MCYGQELTANDTIRTNNSNGGLPIAKWTNLRTGLYSTVIVGLRGGINLRLMRYSDVLLRAAECENEVHGVTDKAIEWINEVRRRANLNDLNKADFADSHELFEQIANVERPKEFGCEYGRGNDLIRWGFFYDANRLQQLKEHGTFLKSGKPDPESPATMVDPRDPKDPVSHADKDKDERIKSSYDSWLPGHEFLPIYQGTLNANPNLKGNSANDGTDNSADFFGRGWTVHPVVNLSK